MTMNFRDEHWHKRRRFNALHLRKGDFVEHVDLDRGPLDVPAAPLHWYVLRTHANRERKVMRAFDRDVISAHMPMQQRTIKRGVSGEARKPHLGRTIIVPIFPGLIFIPDFEMDRSYLRIRSTDGVDDFVIFDERVARFNTSAFLELRAIEAWLATPRSKRKGDRVTVTDGLFAGIEGVIERVDSRGRLKVFLDRIERGVSIELNETQVKLEASATSRKIVRPSTVPPDRAQT